MSTSLSDPLLLGGVIAGTAGLTLLAHARVQSRLLRRRLAAGTGTAVIDPTTGLFAPITSRHYVRAEVNRASRLDRMVDVWIGEAPDRTTLESLSRELAFALPSGVCGLRMDDTRVCVVSCADVSDPRASLEQLNWTHRRIPADEHALRDILGSLAEVSNA